MLSEHYYQFAIIDPLKRYAEKDMEAFFITGGEEVDFYIYTKAPSRGGMSYAEAPDEKFDYSCVLIITHNNTCSIQLNGKMKLKRCKSREDVAKLFNEYVRKYLSCESYIVDEKADMGIHPDVIAEIGRYLCVKDDTNGGYKPSTDLEEYCSSPRDIYKMFLKDKQQIYK